MRKIILVVMAILCSLLAACGGGAASSSSNNAGSSSAAKWDNSKATLEVHADRLVFRPAVIGNELGHLSNGEEVSVEASKIVSAQYNLFYSNKPKEVMPVSYNPANPILVVQNPPMSSEGGIISFKTSDNKELFVITDSKWLDIVADSGLKAEPLENGLIRISKDAAASTATDTNTSTSTNTNTSISTGTNTNTNTGTSTATSTGTNTSTSTNTATGTSTNTSTDTNTSTATSTSTGTNTSTGTGTNTTQDSILSVEKTGDKQHTLTLNFSTLPAGTKFFLGQKAPNDAWVNYTVDQTTGKVVINNWPAGEPIEFSFGTVSSTGIQNWVDPKGQYVYPETTNPSERRFRIVLP